MDTTLFSLDSLAPELDQLVQGARAVRESGSGLEPLLAGARALVPRLLDELEEQPGEEGGWCGYALDGGVLCFRAETPLRFTLTANPECISITVDGTLLVPESADRPLPTQAEVRAQRRELLDRIKAASGTNCPLCGWFLEPGETECGGCSGTGVMDGIVAAVAAAARAVADREEPEEIRCENCGETIPEERMKFCPECGTRRSQD